MPQEEIPLIDFLNIAILEIYYIQHFSECSEDIGIVHGLELTKEMKIMCLSAWWRHFLKFL